jgi:sec-independent protein translocase protein TatC
MFVVRPRTGEMPFLEHLEELRWRILWSLASLLVTTGIGFFLVTRFNVLVILTAPVCPFVEDCKLYFLSPMDPFFITLKLALLVGLILAAPIMVYQAWAFFSPALLPSERKAIVPSLYFGVVLFAAGVVMAYYVVLPLALGFSMSFQADSLEQAIVVTEYLGVVTRLLLAFGLVFELPVVILVLSFLGIVTPETLVAKRRFAIAGITVLSCVLTPGDVQSSIFMMVPLFVLYEFSIVLSRLVVRRRVAAAGSGSSPRVFPSP